MAGLNCNLSITINEQGPLALFGDLDLIRHLEREYMKRLSLAFLGTFIASGIDKIFSLAGLEFLNVQCSKLANPQLTNQVGYCFNVEHGGVNNPQTLSNILVNPLEHPERVYDRNPGVGRFQDVMKYIGVVTNGMLSMNIWPRTFSTQFFNIGPRTASMSLAQGKDTAVINFSEQEVPQVRFYQTETPVLTDLLEPAGLYNQAF